ncbi:hypothetical protein ALC62_14067 [Cyphomyrmex costatus]|uniref:Uncharacterized protein n=1 Tax=Cyphomyrmex costatus TaxID=456900 RepID=A0A195C2U4_9HYME|nr:hypothetical protein ALC62_14067 [Cyphomyrmex costatus]
MKRNTYEKIKESETFLIKKVFETARRNREIARIPVNNGPINLTSFLKTRDRIELKTSNQSFSDLHRTRSLPFLPDVSDNPLAINAAKLSAVAREAFANVTRCVLMTTTTLDKLRGEKKGDLNTYLFRPNILVSSHLSNAPFSEEDWEWIKIKNTIIKMMKPVPKYHRFTQPYFAEGQNLYINANEEETAHLGVYCAPIIPGDIHVNDEPSQQDISLTVAFAVVVVGLPCFPHLPVTAAATDLTRVSRRTRVEFGVFRTRESGLLDNRKSKKIKGNKRVINRVAENSKNIRKLVENPGKKNLVTLKNEGRKIMSCSRKKERKINRLSL